MGNKKGSADAKKKNPNTNKFRIEERIETLTKERDQITPEDRKADDGYSYMRIQARIEELEDLKGRITG